MAHTPNNDIEKRLRDYAQQRRDAVGTPEMHPATRAMLQAEVKQKLGSTVVATTARAGWLRFWPRLALALGVIVVLGVAAILLVPPGHPAKEPLTLAKLDEPKPVMNRAAPAAVAPVLASAPVATPADSPVAEGSLRRPEADIAAIAPAGGGVVTTARENYKSSAGASARMEPAKALKGGSMNRDLAKSSDANSTVAGSINAAPKVGQGFFIAGQDRAKESTASNSGISSAAKSATLAIASDSLTMKPASDKDLKTATHIAGKKAEVSETLFDDANASQNNFNTKLAANGQRFRNLATVEKQKLKVPRVLDEFTVAQDGEALTVIDHDGSVYNGYARIAPTESQTFNNGYNVERANPVQLVPNSNAGGRARAALEQRAMNNAPQASQAPSQAEVSQSFAFGQAAQIQNATPQLNYFFRVEGTNRSLNQRVVFTGNLLQNSGSVFNNNAGAFQNSKATTQNYQQQVAPTGNVYFNNAAQNAPAFNNVINGSVQLGNQKPGELNALSVGQ